jgi:Ca2+-binding RTX toxin-like protein
VVVYFLMGCVVLMVVGCAGVRSEAPQEEQQGHTEGSNKDQTSSLEATASEEAQCEGTRSFQKWREHFTTNDLPGCPHGGLLLGTDKPDKLAGQEGDDKIRGLGGKDEILGGAGNDVIYAGPGDDSLLAGDDGPAAGDDVIYGGPGDEMEIIGGNGDDVIYGGDGNDSILEMDDRGHDKLYCGKGKDGYDADKNDFVSSSCEKKFKWRRIY